MPGKHPGLGLISVLLFAFMQNGVFSVVRRLSPQAGMAFAVVLVALYGRICLQHAPRAARGCTKPAHSAPEKELER